MYIVMMVLSSSQQARGEVSKYIVTNQPLKWKSSEHKWPWVAEFPVAVGYSQADQERRADEYCDYMNRTIPAQPPIGD